MSLHTLAPSGVAHYDMRDNRSFSVAWHVEDFRDRLGTRRLASMRFSADAQMSPHYAWHGCRHDTAMGVWTKWCWNWGGHSASKFNCYFPYMGFPHFLFYEKAGYQRRLRDIVAKICNIVGADWPSFRTTLSPFRVHTIDFMPFPTKWSWHRKANSNFLHAVSAESYFWVTRSKGVGVVTSETWLSLP